MNFKECHCCQEIDQCVEALHSPQVLEDTQGVAVLCITQHPGFVPVCLNKWTLRLAATKFSKIDGKSYTITGSEEA